MRKLILSALFVIALCSVSAFAQKSGPEPSPSPSPAPKAEAPTLNGKWSLSADAGGQVVDILVEIKQTGDTFTGTTSSSIGNGTIESGKVTGKTFKATLKADVQGQIVDFVMEGSIDGDKISGTFTNSGFGSIPFSAARNK